jgi:hypothetical protein
MHIVEFQAWVRPHNDDNEILQNDTVIDDARRTKKGQNLQFQCIYNWLQRHISHKIANTLILDTLHCIILG